MTEKDKSESVAAAQHEKRQMGRAGLILSTATLFSRILGLVRNQILSHFFGAGIAADAFIAAFTIPNALRRLFGEGALTPAFVSLFTREIRNPEHPESWKSFLSASFFWLISLTSLLSLLGILFSAWLVNLYVPEFRDLPEKYELTITLTQILWPFLIFISLAALFMGVLNSFNHFAAPALGPAVMNLTVILLAPLLFYLDLGGEDGEYQIHIFALVTVLSSITQILIQWPALRRLGAFPLVRFDLWDPRVKELFLLLAPSVFGMAVYQLNIIINRVFASGIPGAVSHLYYADLLIELPVSLIATSIGVAAVPSFTRLYLSGDRQALGEGFRFSMCLNLGLAIPSALGLLALSQALVSSLYYSGEFLWSDVLSSQHCLILYALGLPFFCGLRGVLPLFFAARDTRTPAIAGLLALGVNFICASQLAPLMGAGGIALATSISSFANFGILLIICIYRFPEFRWGQVLQESLKILIASFLMGALLFLPNNLWLGSIWALPGIRLEKISTLLLLVFLGGVFYFIFARLFKLREIETLSQQLLSRWRRRQNRL